MNDGVAVNVRGAAAVTTHGNIDDVLDGGRANGQGIPLLLFPSRLLLLHRTASRSRTMSGAKTRRRTTTTTTTTREVPLRQQTRRA